MQNTTTTNRLAQFFNDYFFLLILLPVFVYFKLPHLNYPFYWDECWPYASAIQRLYDHGPSLMPNAIDPDYSRGHPMLFHFLAASWMKLFGRSHTVMHAFPLAIAVTLLIAVYTVGLRLFHKKVAILASLLVAFQVMFFVQSSFLLLEIFIALTGLLSIYCYTKRKYLLTALLLTALFYTKESGLVVGVVLGLDALRLFFDKKESWRTRWLNILSVAIPFFLIALFFIVQKVLLGWYIFPFHATLIDKSIGSFINKMKGCVGIVFINDLRYYLFLLLALLGIIAARLRKDWRYATVALPFLFGFALFQLTFGIKILLALFTVLFYASLLWGVRQVLKTIVLNAVQQKLIVLLTAFILLFFMFSSINMFIARYLIITLVPVLLITSVFIYHFSHAIAARVIYPVTVLIAGILCFAFYKDKGVADTNLGAFNAMRVQQHLVAYLEQHELYDQEIGTNAYLERMHLTDPYTGFLKSDRIFSKVHWEILDDTQVAIFSNIEPDYQYDALKANPSFKRVYRVAVGEAWGEIYVKAGK